MRKFVGVILVTLLISCGAGRSMVPEVAPATSASSNTIVVKQLPKYKLSFANHGNDSFETEIIYAAKEWNEKLGYECFGEYGKELKVSFYEQRRISPNGNTIAGLARSDVPSIEFYIYVSGLLQKVVALHEIGHIIGLKHSDNPKDIMYYLANQELEITQESVDKARKWLIDHAE